MNNSLYLKRYVETHPDNKMAWYLLGKDYAANGEQGKANYCFNRAEEVYEAFELSKVPSDIWKNYELRLLHLESEKDKKRRRIRRALLTVMLMILALLPSVDAPGGFAGSVVYDQVKETEWAGVNQKEEKEGGDRRERPLFTAIAARDKNWSNVPSLLLAHPDKLPKWTVALGMKRSGQWEIWSEQMPIVYGIQRDDSGSIGIQPYKGVGTECDCKPLDDKPLKAAAKTWTQRQVEIAVLSEAIQQFRNHNRKTPESLEELTKQFPNNWLSGRSKEMKRLFPVLVSVSIEARATDGKGLLHSQESGLVSQRLPEGYGSSPDGTAFFKQSLEVIIDRKNHRLGVVNGSVLIRNYEVGLGRDEKTPLGDFRISDKVINPNGSATGTYGSRGMQLSDSNYAIHGTQDINSIGGNESEGCIRMHKKDVEELFDLVPMGTKVRIEEGVLPGGLVIPKERFALKHSAEQSNPRKVYHWLD